MKKLLFVFLLIISQIAYSQDVPSARVTVFKPNDDQVRNVNKKDSLAGHEHNCIKWNYCLLTRGVFLLNWEFRVVGNLTVEVGLGLTYRDFVFELTKPNFAGNNGMAGVWDSVGSPRINLCGEAGARYYLSGFDNMEGVYVQLAFSYRPYSFPNSSEARYGSLVPGYNFFDTQFKIGYQYSWDWSDLTYDVYMGIGYRNANVNYYVQETSNNPVTGAYQTSWVPQTFSGSWPQFLFGAKIGYAF